MFKSRFKSKENGDEKFEIEFKEGLAKSILISSEKWGCDGKDITWSCEFEGEGCDAIARAYEGPSRDSLGCVEVDEDNERDGSLSEES